MIHHATSSNLDKRGIGDIEMLTVDEYLEKSKLGRLGYRLYRNPLVMFGLGPLYMVLVLNRFNRKGAKRKERMNTYLSTRLLVAICGTLILSTGWSTFLLVHGLTLFIAGSLGIWLFYIQHTYEDSYFEVDSEWDYVKAAVEGERMFDRRSKNVRIFKDTVDLIENSQRLQEAISNSLSRQQLYLEADEVAIPESLEKKPKSEYTAVPALPKA